MTDAQTPETNQPTPDERDGTTTEHTQAENVTREQNGQFIEESSGIERVVVPNRNAAGGKLEGADLDSIRAKNVTMDRSGAEQIDAETVQMTNAGAKSIRSASVEMQNSGSLTVTGDKVTMNQSSAMVVAAQSVELAQAGVFSVQAEHVSLNDTSRVGALIAGKVEAGQELRVGLGVIGKVEQGDVRVAVTPQAALAFGAGFAVVMTVLRRIFGQNS